MGRVTRRDPEKKIKDTQVVLGSSIAGTVPPGSIGGGTPEEDTIPVVDENGNVQWKLISEILEQFSLDVRYEPVISLGDPPDPNNPQFVFAENGDIVMGGVPL